MANSIYAHLRIKIENLINQVLKWIQGGPEKTTFKDF